MGKNWYLPRKCKCRIRRNRYQSLWTVRISSINKLYKLKLRTIQTLTQIHTTQKTTTRPNLTTHLLGFKIETTKMTTAHQSMETSSRTLTAIFRLQVWFRRAKQTRIFMASNKEETTKVNSRTNFSQGCCQQKKTRI